MIAKPTTSQRPFSGSRAQATSHAACRRGLKPHRARRVAGKADAVDMGLVASFQSRDPWGHRYMNCRNRKHWQASNWRHQCVAHLGDHVKSAWREEVLSK